MSNVKTRSAALPLLFAAVLLAVGVAALLLPLFDCPPCGGHGFISQRSSKSLRLYECLSCRRSGRLRALPRLLANRDPLPHLGRVTGYATLD